MKKATHAESPVDEYKRLIQSARKILAWDHTSNCFPPFLIVSLRFGNGNTSSLLSHRHLLSGLMLSNGWPTVYSHSSDSRFARLRAFSWEASQKQPPARTERIQPAESARPTRRPVEVRRCRTFLIFLARLPCCHPVPLTFHPLVDPRGIR